MLLTWIYVVQRVTLCGRPIQGEGRKPRYRCRSSCGGMSAWRVFLIYVTRVKYVHTRKIYYTSSLLRVICTIPVLKIKRKLQAAVSKAAVGRLIRKIFTPNKIRFKHLTEEKGKKEKRGLWPDPFSGKKQGSHEYRSWKWKKKKKSVLTSSFSYIRMWPRLERLYSCIIYHTYVPTRRK